MAKASEKRPSMTTRVKGAIRELTEIHGFPPTIRELSDHLGLQAHSTVVYHLDLLKAAGVVTHQPRKQRTIRIVEIDELP